MLPFPFVEHRNVNPQLLRHFRGTETVNDHQSRRLFFELYALSSLLYSWVF